MSRKGWKSTITLWKFQKIFPNQERLIYCNVIIKSIYLKAILFLFTPHSLEVAGRLPQRLRGHVRMVPVWFAPEVSTFLIVVFWLLPRTPLPERLSNRYRKPWSKWRNGLRFSGTGEHSTRRYGPDRAGQRRRKWCQPGRPTFGTYGDDERLQWWG